MTERESEMIHLLACQLQHFGEGDCRRFVDHYITTFNFEPAPSPKLVTNMGGVGLERQEFCSET